MIPIFTNPCLAISDMTADFLLSLLPIFMIIMIITTAIILTMTNNNHDLNHDQQ